MANAQQLVVSDQGNLRRQKTRRLFDQHLPKRERRASGMSAHCKYLRRCGHDARQANRGLAERPHRLQLQPVWPLFFGLACSTAAGRDGQHAAEGIQQHNYPLGWRSAAADSLEEKSCTMRHETTKLPGVQRGLAWRLYGTFGLVE
eukprot:scaffold1466_cov249-Pinguiococcus_pyrenoidosus.AAC.19